MILVNGALGIGTGFSTQILCYNPKDIIMTLKQRLTRKEGETLDDILGFRFDAILSWIYR